MKFALKRRGKFIAIFILILTNVSIGFYLAANVFDWKIDFLNINPSDKTHWKFFELFCPPSDPRAHMTGLLLSLDVYVTYSGTLAEGSPVHLAATGYLYPEGIQTIERVSVGFEGSSYYDATDSNVSDTPPAFEPILENSDVYAMQFSPPTSGTIVWDTQGDYYPFIILNFKNGSAPRTVNYRDQDHEVYVCAFDVVQQENTNRKNTAISTSLVMFALVDGGALIVRLLSRKTDDKSNQKSANHNPKRLQDEEAKIEAPKRQMHARI